MDIDLLSKMVKELILDNEKVVLPGLGCFVAELVPATFSDRGYTINPPYRKLYFRSRPDEGRLMADLYARSNHVEPEMADRIIRDFLKELRSVLYTRKTVVFPGLGRLRATKENNIFFIADEDLDIYPISFALETISMKSHKEREERAVSAIGELKDMMAGLTPEKETAAEEIPSAEEETPAVEETAAAEEETPVEEETAVPQEEVPVPEEVPETAPVEETGTVIPEIEDIELVEDDVPVTEYEPAVEEPEAESAEEEIPGPAEPARKSWKTILLVAGIIIIVAAVIIGVFFAISYLAPDFMDKMLYSEEELEILRYGK